MNTAVPSAGLSSRPTGTATRDNADAPRPGSNSWRWTWVKRIATVLFLGLVAWLLVGYAQRIDWQDVGQAMVSLPTHTLALAALLALSSHLLYSTFDLFGRHVTGHGLGVRPVMTVTFIAYAFGLNFGSLIGGFAFRYRLYARLGLSAADTTRVLSLSLATNWLGYLMLGGLAFALAPMDLPPDWKVDSGQLRWIGAAMVVGALVYLALCAFSPRRQLSVRGHDFELPSARLAGLQLLVSMSNWALMGGVIWLLLQGALPYPTVLSVLLVGAVAGIVTHVPAGLGVLEAVFVALLSHALPESRLLAALLAYRVLYYLVPLSVALVVYLVVELRARRLRAARA